MVLSDSPISSRKAQESADLSVGVSKETGEDFLTSGVHSSLV